MGTIQIDRVLVRQDDNVVVKAPSGDANHAVPALELALGAIKRPFATDVRTDCGDVQQGALQVEFDLLSLSKILAQLKSLGAIAAKGGIKPNGQADRSTVCPRPIVCVCA